MPSFAQAHRRRISQPGGSDAGSPSTTLSRINGAHIPETILIPLKAPNESTHDEIARRRLVALLDTIACADHISPGQVVKRALVREVEQHIRRALRTLASPTTLSEQEEIDGFCKVLGLGDDWNYTPR